MTGYSFYSIGEGYLFASCLSADGFVYNCDRNLTGYYGGINQTQITFTRVAKWGASQKINCSFNFKLPEENTDFILNLDLQRPSHKILSKATLPDGLTIKASNNYYCKASLKVYVISANPSKFTKNIQKRYHKTSVINGSISIIVEPVCRVKKYIGYYEGKEWECSYLFPFNYWLIPINAHSFSRNKESQTEVPNQYHFSVSIFIFVLLLLICGFFIVYLLVKLRQKTTISTISSNANRQEYENANATDAEAEYAEISTNKNQSDNTEVPATERHDKEVSVENSNAEVSYSVIDRKSTEVSNVLYHSFKQ